MRRSVGWANNKPPDSPVTVTESPTPQPPSPFYHPRRITSPLRPLPFEFFRTPALKAPYLRRLHAIFT